jgi:hypothetical protein
MAQFSDSRRLRVKIGSMTVNIIRFQSFNSLTVNPIVDSSPPQSATRLEPNFAIAIALIGFALLCLLVQPWVGLGLSLFGLFLLIQTVSLRLYFTADALDIYRGETLIRQFPYQDWQNWQIFWQPLPVLFYFKEVKSIHFLPILFDPKALQTCLEQHIPKSNQT